MNFEEAIDKLQNPTDYSSYSKEELLGILAERDTRIIMLEHRSTLDREEAIRADALTRDLLGSYMTIVEFIDEKNKKTVLRSATSSLKRNQSTTT